MITTQYDGFISILKEKQGHLSVTVTVTVTVTRAVALSEQVDLTVWVLLRDNALVFNKSSLTVTDRDRESRSRSE
jgi:hypothetical protein